MAYLPYVRCVMQGITESTQTWSMGFSVHNDGTATSSELFTWLSAVDGLAKTMFGTTGVVNQWDTATKYTSVAAYSYPAVGGAAAVAGVTSSGVVGTSSSRSVPPQIAVVISERSGIAGRKGRGRMYYPMCNPTLAPNGQLASSFCTTLANAVKVFFDGVNALSIGSAASIVCIGSRDTGAGAPVTGIIVDTKLDTQRRRTDKIVATASVEVLL